MKLEEVLAKITKAEELTDEEKAFVKDWKPVDAEGLANSRAANARKDAEAKTIEAQTQIDKLKAEIAELKDSDLSDKEKSDKEFVKISDALIEAKKVIEDLEKTKVSMGRTHGIDKLMAGIRTVKGVDPELVRQGISRALNDVDLTDKDAVEKAIMAFKTGNPSVFLADSNSGAGSKGGGDSGTGTTYTREQIDNMSLDEFEKNQEAIGKQNAAGLIK